MRKTDQTLLEQLGINEFEIVSRMALFSIGEADIAYMKKAKPMIERELDRLVNQFYELQTAVPEIALLIGDADTLGRLRNAQFRYIQDLFSGYYDIEYVNNRLRIGLVHKRIGVEPKLYLAAIQTLRDLLMRVIDNGIEDKEERAQVSQALQKLLMFDISLVFDTYIRSLVSEIEISREKSEQYAAALEEKIKERTQQLERMSRTDHLTGLENTWFLVQSLTRVLRAAERRSEPVTLAYIDVNDFKQINDAHGHQHGDVVLQCVANSLKESCRMEDLCFRYGGDEFCVIMPNCRISHAKLAWEERLLQILQAKEFHPTLSIGYAQTGPEVYVEAEKLIRLADEQMYAAKQDSKSTEPGNVTPLPQSRSGQERKH